MSSPSDLEEEVDHQENNPNNIAYFQDSFKSDCAISSNIEKTIITKCECNDTLKNPDN